MDSLKRSFSTYFETGALNFYFHDFSIKKKINK